jgi:purine-nucleoside phosphorylase
VTLELDIEVLPAAARTWVAAACPRIAVVLGSGFGSTLGLLDPQVRIAYQDIHAFPDARRGVEGHAGELLLGSMGSVPLLIFSGRVHAYQGASALDAAFPVRIAAAAGCEILVVTNSSGAVSPSFAGGDVVLIEDHINLTGANPLVGWPGPPGGTPFVPMRDAYDRECREVARSVAIEQGIVVREGVYAGLLGPVFETPAEVRWLAAVGADVVGMSTVPEVIAARALGLRVLGISLVTNRAAGADLSHSGVLDMGERMSGPLSRLLAGILSRL